MSLSIINRLIGCLQKNLNVNSEDIIIKNIEFDDTYLYTIELNIKDKLYSIKHFKPLNPVYGVNYGHGDYVTVHVFNTEKGYFERVFINTDKF